LRIQDAIRLKELELENAKLKRLLAESMLAHDTLREFLSHLPCRLAPACSQHERWWAVPGNKA